LLITNFILDSFTLVNFSGFIQIGAARHKIVFPNKSFGAERREAFASADIFSTGVW
jgi:hypothetical protein